MTDAVILKIALLILVLPAAALWIHILFGSRMPRKGDWFATLIVFVSLFLAGVLFIKMMTTGRYFDLEFNIPWLNLGSKTISAGILVDNLTIIMLGVVTLISAFVHLYSIGYMHGDAKYCRYYSYLLLFTTSMLGLVLTNNLLVLYVFWELVGFSSYLLIGHWFEKKSAADAAVKAFIVTRIGDVGMFIGIMIIYFTIGSFNYSDIFQAVADGTLSGKLRTLVGLGIFMGAMGKSAQFPLHVWLPDAMEGPTPISALIHAATMVAAGVYLVGRLFLLFSPTNLLIIAYVGGFTAIFAATIALVRDDIKRVLAYSTVSQLGYMMLGLGVGSYVAGLFHLTTHASFKALLFLGSGSVIHAVGTNSMRSMGGLAKKMPITAITFLIATLAIIGCPFFSGFYSKDAIIGAALKFGIQHPAHLGLFVLSVLTAGLTAFYMFRCFFKTFTGKPRDAQRYAHAHESPAVMTIPLMVLALFSIFAGYGGWFKKHNPAPSMEKYKTVSIIRESQFQPGGATKPIEHSAEDANSPFNPELEHSDEEHLEHIAHRGTLASTLPLSFLGVLLAYFMFFRRLIDSGALIRRFRALYNLLWNKYFVDEFYHAVFVAGLILIAKIARAFDNYIIDGLVNLSGVILRLVSWFIGRFDLFAIDGAVNGTAWSTGSLGELLSFWQTGKIRQYVLFVILSLAVIALIFVVLR